MEAKTYLKQIGRLDKLIDNKLIEMQQWRERASSITAQINGVAVKSTGDIRKMPAAVHKMVDLIPEIDRLVNRYVSEKIAVICSIEQLEDVTDYNLLHMIYIQGRSLSDVAEEYGKDYSWATTRHGRALEKMQAILDAKQGEH